MANVITPDELQNLYDELPSEQLINDPRVLELRQAVMTDYRIAVDYQPCYDDISGLIDSARNNNFLQHGGRPNAKF